LESSALAPGALARRILVAALPALVLGLGWQGSRGLWEPDEGRNANIALGMLESGDWLVPRLNGDPYLDKPPLHFWSVAAGMRLLGADGWGARLPNALFFVVTAALLGAVGRRMWDERAGQLSAWVYATTLAPFVAANVVTPDTGLAAFVVLLVYAYWGAEHGGHGSVARCGWWLLAGAACGLGLLTKGPAMLVFLPPLAAHLALRWRHRGCPLGPGPWLGLTVAALLGLAWYLPIVRSLPGAGAYLLDNQAVGRLVGSRWDRSPGWAGAVEVYLPTLVAGVLPWSFWWLARARRLSWWRPLRPSASTLLLGLWFALPLIVFALASSRLPLYLLPLFAPFALATGRGLSLAWSGASRARRQWAAVLLIAWCAVLLGLKVVAARYPSHRDARRQAAWIAAQGVGAESTLMIVDTAGNGLRLYGYPELEWVRARGEAYPLFSPLRNLGTVAPELATRRRRVAAVVAPSWTEEVARQLTTAGFACEARLSELRIALLLCSPNSLARP
jgi:4-amino-4-deoxy-L-arabinose transferase-like glycosyltransferase